MWNRSCCCNTDKEANMFMYRSSWMETARAILCKLNFIIGDWTATCLHLCINIAPRFGWKCCMFSVCLFVCIYVCMRVCMSAHLWVCLSVFLSQLNCPFACLLICLPACLSLCLSIYMSTRQLICLHVCRNVCVCVFQIFNPPLFPS